MNVLYVLAIFLSLSTASTVLTDSTQTDCPICLKKYGEVSDVNQSTRTRGIPLPCSHKLCSDCLPQLRVSKCPLCRVGFAPIRNGELAPRALHAPDSLVGSLVEDVRAMRRACVFMSRFISEVQLIRGRFSGFARYRFAGAVLDGLLQTAENSLQSL